MEQSQNSLKERWQPVPKNPLNKASKLTNVETVTLINPFKTANRS